MDSITLLSWNIMQRSVQYSADIVDVTKRLGADFVSYSEWRPPSDWSPGNSQLEIDLKSAGYVNQEPMHSHFLEFLGQTVPVHKLNGILVASRLGIRASRPPIWQNEAPSSWVEVFLPSLKLTVVSIRPIVGTKKVVFDKKKYWSWIIKQTARLKNQNALILGDFNIYANNIGTKNDPGLSKLIKSGWRDVALEQGMESENTYYPRNRLSAKRLDYALLSPSFTGKVEAFLQPIEVDGIKISGPTINRPISDHTPIVITLGQD